MVLAGHETTGIRPRLSVNFFGLLASWPSIGCRQAGSSCQRGGLSNRQTGLGCRHTGLNRRQTGLGHRHKHNINVYFNKSIEFKHIT